MPEQHESAQRHVGEPDRLEASEVLVSDLVAAMAGEMTSIGRAIEELGGLIAGDGRHDRETLVRLQTIDHDAQILSNLSRLLEHVAGSIPHLSKVSENEVRRVVLMTDLSNRLLSSSHSQGEGRHAGDPEYF